jgi:hypothetical protein
MRRLIEGHGDTVARHTYHVSDWLADLRSRGFIGNASRATFSVIVDTLAAAGERAAVRLQRLDE